MSRTTREDVRADAPDPDSSAKPDSPSDMPTPSKKYVLRKTMREFSKDQCTDIAASLTYYAVLAMFPAVIALLSLVSLVNQGPSTVKTLLDIQDIPGFDLLDETEEPTTGPEPRGG